MEVDQMTKDRFDYDGVSRLVFGTAGGGQFSEENEYDAFGNRTFTENTHSGGAGEIDISAFTNRFLGTPSEPTNYDYRGNLLQWGTSFFEYDPFDMIVRQTTSSDHSFVYTADDERLIQIDNDAPDETWTLRDLDGKLIREFFRDTSPDTSWQKDTIHRNGLVLATRGPQVRRYAHLDHLGTVRLWTGPPEMGHNPGHHVYLPFGEEVTLTNDGQELQFTGHERDGFGRELDYMHARYCSPGLGRFLSVDPANSSLVAQPQTWNRYAYASSNPIRHVDPDGELGVLAFGVGVAIAVGVGILSGTDAANAPTSATDELIESGGAATSLKGAGTGAAIAVAVDSFLSAIGFGDSNAESFDDLFERSEKTENDQIRRRSGGEGEARRQFEQATKPGSRESRGDVEIGLDKKSGNRVVLRKRSTDANAEMTLSEQTEVRPGDFEEGRKVRFDPLGESGKE